MADSTDDPTPIMLGGIEVQSEEAKVVQRPPALRSVVVTDIQMPFGSMVVFMVKLALASVPAAGIILILTALASGILRGLFR